jgi:hypothetical protein
VGKNKIAKLNRLHYQLAQRSLVIEASLVADLQDNLYKEAGIIDDAYKLIEDIKNNPEIVEYISLAMKLSAALALTTGYGASIAPMILKASSGADIIAAAGYVAKSNWLKATLSIISAILSLPSNLIGKIYNFILSEKFVDLAMRFTRLGHDKAWISASYISDFFKRSVPAIFDGLLNLLGYIGKALHQFIPTIAKMAGKAKEDVIAGLGSYLKQMESDITRVSGMVTPT